MRKAVKCQGLCGLSADVDRAERGCVKMPMCHLRSGLWVILLCISQLFIHVAYKIEKKMVDAFFK